MDDFKKEYEEFVYTISHDFSAPIRHIMQFGKLLKKQLGDDLDGDSLKYIEYMQNAAQRLDDMQKGLLELSQITTHGKEYQVCDANTLLEKALNNLAGIIKMSNASITYEILPEIYCEPSRISQVFYNLIENAIKFQENENDIKIHISAKNKGDDVIFKISDNGIGISEDNRKTAFQIFKRLHAPEDYNGGMGIGLTICKKIIERHNGEIWFEDNEGGGVSVLFSIIRHH